MNNLKAPSLQSLLDSDRGSNDSLLAESLQLDIEELDDAEYSIPTVDTLPTLESVLNDLEDDFDSISQDTGNLIAATPTPSIDDALKQTSILRHVMLQGVTTQIASAADRVNSGNASAVAINHKIAVGTSHGHVLCFDLTQTLKWCCRDYTAQGAVSALSFNEDSTRLLVGFARGYIIMIDTTSGDVIRSLSDVITPNTGVLHIKWTEKPALALCSDSGGSVWCLTFTRRLGIRGCTSRCLFSGARGEVCAVEPLLLGEDDHPLKPYSIVALATLSKFFVVMVRPRLKVIKYQVMTGPGECLPLLAWQMVLIQAADSTRTVDPVLAAGRGTHLYFHQLCYNQGRIKLLYLRKIKLTYNLLALHWIGPKSIVCVDTAENLHLSEVRTNKELESLDMGCVGLVYSSAQFKGLATGGNVSPALALAGSMACYNSFVSSENHLYILGARSLHAITVRAWCDRITHLSNQHRWDEAFELAIEIYRSCKDRVKRQSLAKDKILKLFEDYLLKTNRCPDLCLNIVISALIEIQEYSLLWGELWDRLPSKVIYINLITDHILNDNIAEISPIVAQSLVEYWDNISTQKLELIILKMNWEYLDLHQVLTISKRERLYRALMHLNTKALGDYTVSLTELIPLILEQDTPDLGNSILVYISSCLAGRGYPSGDIKLDLIASVKHEVMRCLTVIHSNRAPDNESTYPYLRILMQFNIRETLNVLSLAFQEQEFHGKLGHSQRQRIINILLDITTGNDSNVWSSIGCLLNFIVQQIITKSLPDNDQSMLNKILPYLTRPNIQGESTRDHFEREQALYDLITTDNINLTKNQILEIARAANYYHITEYILERNQNYANILEECYINYPERNTELFTYIKKHIKNKSRLICPQLELLFEQLFQINPQELIAIIIDFNPKLMSKFLLKFKNNKSHEEDLFKFLSILFRLSDSKISKNTEVNFDEHIELYIELLCTYNQAHILEFLKNNDHNYKLDQTIEIIKDHNLKVELIYLYERKGDYQTAFNLSLDVIKTNFAGASSDLVDANVIDVTQLCSRASEVLSDVDKETLWFELIDFVLNNLPKSFNLLKKDILYLASHHVNLTKLIQLILNNSSNSNNDNNYGDIKHIILSMLSNSNYEKLLVHTTSKILDKDLHNLLYKEKSKANQGLQVKSIKCMVCRFQLYQKHNGDRNVVIYGNCGHSIHEECAINKTECPRCSMTIKARLVLPKPSLKVLGEHEYAGYSDQNGLKLDAPPRIGIINKKL